MAKTKYNLHLKGYVGGWNFDSDYVDFVLNKNTDKEVAVLIDSLGGQLNTALSISSAFRRHSNVRVHFVGMSATDMQNLINNLESRRPISTSWMPTSPRSTRRGARRNRSSTITMPPHLRLIPKLNLHAIHPHLHPPQNPRLSRPRRHPPLDAQRRDPAVAPLHLPQI